MGAIRGIFLVIVAVLLFLSLISMTLFWTLSQSLSYNNIEKQSLILIKDVLKENTDLTNKIHEIYPLIQSYCQNNSDYVFNTEGYTFDISCETVLQGEDAIMEESIKGMVHKIYYTEYNCNFIDCIKESQVPLFLISEKAHNYWNTLFYFSLIISFVLSVLIFFLVEKKTNWPILTGSLLIISSVPFIKLDVILSLFSDKTLFKLLKIFFSEAYFVSFKILIAGIVLIASGIILKIFKVGFFISNLISKFKKKPARIKEKQKIQIPKKAIKKKPSKPKSK